ncbi:MAG TPA: methyltransferase type 11, partial [Burkholderiales bacterium]
HLEFDEVRALVHEALRVLQPGGLLILETPNPENVVVGCTRFYLDPTHRRPIPPQLLSFLAEYYGYERVKVLRLQEAAELHGDNGGIALLDVLSGVSPDYAVVARKRGDERVLAATEAAFAADHGVTLESLAERYDRVREEREEALRAELGRLAAIAGLAEERVARAERRAREAAERRGQEAEERAARAEGEARDAEARAAGAEAAATRAEERAVRAEREAREAAAMLDAVFHSRSWRITRPLRWLSGAVRDAGCGAKQRAKRALTPLLMHTVRIARSHPRMKQCMLLPLRRAPRLEARLRDYVAVREQADEVRRGAPAALEDSELSPRAREIYLELAAAVEKKGPGVG